MRIETRAVHSGRSVDPATGAVVSAIHPSTTFERDVDGGYDRGHLYARNSNPNRDALEHCLADLEGGLAAAAFGSGTAATMAVFQARAAGAVSVCDNTIATPILQTPLALGADLVHHATTKYLGGHSDVMGGAIVARSVSGIFEQIRKCQVSGGAIPSPFDCWLVLRSIRSLPYRVRAHSDHALRVAQFLAQHDRVTAVHYPSLPHHPGYDVAARQMRGGGGVLSVEIEGGRDAAMKVAARVRLFTRATSYGGADSYIEHRASIEGAGTRTPEGLLRLSIGLEHPDDLIEDLAQAMA